MPRHGVAAVLAVLVLVSACSTPTTPSRTPLASVVAMPLLTPLPEVVPKPQADAAILAAFDAQAAAALVEAVPDGFDFSSQAILCVALGRRETGGWAVALQSASLADGELRILARETRPPVGGGTAGETFPAGCGALAHSGLPVGELPARADDTVSEEFIVADVISVPSS